MNNEPQLSDLRIFCTVVRCGSFVGTANDMGASPAHISKRIATLESQLGVKLFHRTTRRIVLTQDGEMVHASALTVLAAMASLGDVIASNRSEPSGMLRISCSPRIGRLHISHVLSLLEKRYPRLEIWLELVDRSVDLVGEGYDIDISFGEPSQPQLIGHHLARNSRILCAAPSYLARRGVLTTLADLAGHECLVFRDRDAGFGIWRLKGPHGMESTKVRGQFSSNHADVVRNWAIDGHGIVMLSVWDVAQEIAAGQMLRVLPEYSEPADIWAMTSIRSSHSAKINACVAFLKDHLAQGPHALRQTLEPAQ